MREFARLTDRAKEAIKARDWMLLADLMDANFACVPFFLLPCVWGTSIFIFIEMGAMMPG